MLLNIRANFFRIFEMVRSFRYLKNGRFFLAQVHHAFSYLFKNPYRVSRSFQKEQKIEQIYGQTPLSTLHKISKKCGLTSKDHLIELGAGSGLSALWFASFVGCRVTAIENIPTFVLRAQMIAQRCRFSRLTFKEEDFFRTDFSKASVVYLYGTCLEDEQIEKLIEKLLCLPPKAKVITVSYPLSEYTKKPHFALKKQFVGHFPWGRAQVYLQQRTYE